VGFGRLRSFLSAVFSGIFNQVRLAYYASPLLHFVLAWFHCVAGRCFLTARGLVELGVPSKTGKGVCGSKGDFIFRVCFLCTVANSRLVLNEGCKSIS
jgi:hypothetical protein